MKRNTKKLGVFVMVVAIAMFTAVAMASADDHDWKTIHGDYAITAGMSCFIAPSGFNGNLIPNDPTTASSNSITFQGISTFNRDGTGRLDSTGVLIAPPPVPLPQFPHANAFQFSFTFTYDVADDDTITIDADENSFQVTFDTGPLPPGGVGFTSDKYSLSGRVSEDHKTLTLGSPTTLIQTSTFINTPISFNMICNGSYVFTRLGPIERGGESWERCQ